MTERRKRKWDREKIIRNGLILSTLMSLMIVILYFTYLIYQNTYDITAINDFLIKYIDGPFLWIVHILVYIFAISYIFISIKSKKEVVLKVSFSLFSILTTMAVLTLIINAVAELFGLF